MFPSFTLTTKAFKQLQDEVKSQFDMHPNLLFFANFETVNEVLNQREPYGQLVRMVFFGFAFFFLIN